MNKKRNDKGKLPRMKYLSAMAAGVMASSALMTASMGVTAAGLSQELKTAKSFKPTQAMINEVVEARKKFGFQHDQAYVHDLLTRPENHGAVFGLLTGGHFATPEEVKELEVRLRVQEDGLSILRKARKDSDFAGLYIDGKGNLHIGFTKSAKEKVQGLHKGAKQPDRIHAFQVARTMAELEKLKKRIVKDSPELTANGINISEVSIDIKNNTVSVGVADLNPQLRDAVTSRFGQVEVYEKGFDIPEHRSDTANIMRAGVRITNQSGGSCTSNWKAQDRNTGQLVTVTAGHCGVDVTGTFGGPGDSIFQGRNPHFTPRLVGVTDATSWTFPGINPDGSRFGAAPVDAMRAPLLVGSLPWLYAYDNANAGVFSNGEEAQVGDADGTVVVGTSVCSGGQFSPANSVGGNFKNCGTVSSVNVSRVFARSNGSPDRFTVQNGNVGDYVAISGDSGAPIWRLMYDSSSSTWQAVAVGHHTGGPTGSEFFNNIDLVEDALNVDIRHF